MPQMASHGVVLYIESSSRVDAQTQSGCCQTQGKNARQSHPRQVPLNNGLRAMRLPLGQRIYFRMFNLLMPHALAADCEQSHTLKRMLTAHIDRGKCNIFFY